MRTKYKIQVLFDSILLFVLLYLIGFHLWSENYHEWAGVSFVFVTIIHLAFNFTKIKNVFSGERDAFRNIKLFFNITLGLSFIIAVISGVLLSRNIFSDLSIHNPSDFVRKIHMTSVYWGVICSSVHLGIHWKLLAKFFMRILIIKERSIISKWIIPSVFILISIYGLYNFIQRDVLSYLLMRVDFSFFNFDESKLKFYTGFFSVIIFMSYTTRILLWLLIFRKKPALAI